ncbi:MAG: CHAT domain-containing protein [Bacteroidaceae bacterium]|nr:CHAT domain-containing protein [Bacteroidaceae bacterium]
MNIFKKLFLKWAIWSAEKTGYTMQKIVALRYVSYESLRKEWSLEEYKKLDAARMLAQSEEHWFEELQILIDEVSLLIKIEGDRQLFYEANKRLQELSEIFDMDDEAFAEKFKENYLCFTNRQILKQTAPSLKGFYNYFYVRADFMLAHLQCNTAILCGKAICKIASLSDVVSFEEHIETLFQIAVGYGGLREFSKAMEYYDKALCLARDVQDLTYEYISIIRKLSVCIAAIDLSVHVDIDRDRIAAVQELLALCDRYKLNPYELGKKLISEENSEFRKNRIRESMPFIDNLMALERGDWQTALRSTAELKDAELKVYGGNSEYSNAETLKFVYQLLHSSAAREQAADRNEYENFDVGEDVPCEPEFPDGMFQADKFRLLLFYSKAEAAQMHPRRSLSFAAGAMCIADNVFSDYHIAMSLNAIGQAYEACGNKAEAIKAYREVVGMFERDNHPGSDIFFSSQLMYNSLLEIGNLLKDDVPREAVDVFNKALCLIEKSTDADKDFFKLHTIICRSIAYKNIGESCLAEQDISDAIAMILAHTGKRLRYMDGDLRENYWNEINRIIERVAGLCDEISGDVLRTELYRLILFSKGFLLSSEHSLKTAIYAESMPEDIRKIYQELEAYEQKRKPWGTSTDDSSNEYVEHYLQRMRLTCATCDVIEKYLDFVNDDYKSIADALSDNAVIIDFYDYEIENEDRQYIALVYKREYRAPLLYKVCRESDILEVFDDVEAASYPNGEHFDFTEAYNPEYEYSNKLYNLIFKRITENLGIDSSFYVYVVPSGSLHKIPLESLVVSVNTQCIASDYYKSIVRISHARVMKSETLHNSFKNIELFGGLDYGCNDATDAGERGYKLNYEKGDVTPLLPWNKLLYSIREVGNIALMWDAAKGQGNAREHTLATGTADSFYELNGRNVSVIHFATHGFFETAETAVNLPALKGRYSPMDLSGIVMSNGNVGWLYGSSMQHEGILTASDIAKMDLSGVSLVVLSVCNSGNGVVRSDGLYGLQRAFKKAGVKSIVMSLWNESDEAGTMFMTKFYLHLLFDGLSLADSFNRAKNEVRAQFHHPVYWANFVMID